MKNEQWSKTEKAVAKEAFNLAHQRECEAIANEGISRLQHMESSEELWRVQEFLTNQRNEMAKKYDFGYSMLMIVFGALLKDGWVQLEDLEGLSEDKLKRLKQFRELEQ